MSESDIDLKIKQYFDKHSKWQEQLVALRQLLNQSELTETVKWGIPTYCINNKNVIGLGAFKHHYALWFFNGAAIEDDLSVLTNAQEGKTQHMRHWRFDENSQIDAQQITLYLQRAIDWQKAGGTPPAKEKPQLVIPDLLSQRLKEDSKLNQCFEELTDGKKREYAEYIAQAKQQATQLKRLEKMTPLILAGKGLNDKYRC